MTDDELRGLSAALDREVLTSSVLAGGFSHETCLLVFADGRAVARFGGGDPAIEAAVMSAARGHAPVPEVLLVRPAHDGARPAMVIEYVVGTVLSHVLAEAGDGMADLGYEVGRVVAGVAEVSFDRAGFFADADLAVGEQPPWSQQLAGFAEACMAKVPDGRLPTGTRRIWARMCAENAPALAAIDHQARLAHADVNPKNILVTRTATGWRVDSLLDWEFSYASSAYGDAANMARFGADYPPGFLDGFTNGFADHQPPDLPLLDDWAYLGRVLDMFALSDLTTRPLGHEVADQAATTIESWTRNGVPRRLHAFID